jgi:CO/xanthine dehydrogenase Mo-binding subunit
MRCVTQLVRSTVAHGRVLSIDKSEAERIPGVVPDLHLL